jgi:CHAT domain-containing protein
LGGTIQDGLEVFGLGYQFQRVGVRAVIASLWSIDDSGTQVLMNDFYTELRQGKSKVEALRKAQINALRRPNSQNPYYWAPFILIGSGL